MESPFSWGKAEHVVSDALRAADGAHAAGVIGLSRVRRITDALRGAGMLVDTDKLSPSDVAALDQIRERLQGTRQ